MICIWPVDLGVIFMYMLSPIIGDIILQFVQGFDNNFNRVSCIECVVIEIEFGWSCYFFLDCLKTRIV